MRCKKCMNEAYYSGLCKSCFLRYFERKVRKELRLNRIINRNDTLIITDQLCEYVIRRIIKDMPVKIIKKGKGKHVLPWTADDECCHFLSLFLNNKPLKGIGHGKDVKLFLSLLEDEVAAYAKAKSIGFSRRRKDPIIKVLDELEKKHPQTKHSLMRSINDINDAVHKRQHKGKR